MRANSAVLAAMNASVEHGGRPGMAIQLVRAERFGERLRGLLGRESLLRVSGLWIAPCCAIHTFGMRSAIDAVFIGDQGQVLRVDARLGARRLRYCRGARGVLELASGSAAQLGLDRPGARLHGLLC